MGIKNDLLSPGTGRAGFFLKGIWIKVNRLKHFWKKLSFDVQVVRGNVKIPYSLEWKVTGHQYIQIIKSKHLSNYFYFHE